MGEHSCLRPYRLYQIECASIAPSNATSQQRRRPAPSSMLAFHYVATRAVDRELAGAAEHSTSCDSIGMKREEWVARPHPSQRTWSRTRADATLTPQFVVSPTVTSIQR